MGNIKKFKFYCCFSAMLMFSLCLAFISSGFKACAAGNDGFTMRKGASVKISANTGIRFTAALPESEYSEGNVYGMLIAPEDYVSTNGLTVENVFGENAVYDWAVKDEDGNWIYADNGRTRIVNISYDSLNKNVDGEYLISGSIVNLKESNFERNFVGRAYKGVKTSDGTYEYTMSQYLDGNIANSTRSIFTVAKSAVEDESETKPSDAVKETLRETYLDKVYLKDFSFDSTTGAITEYIGTKTVTEIPDRISGADIVAIGNNAFAGKSVTSVTIPASVTSVGDYAFHMCSGLTEVIFADGIGEITLGQAAFAATAVNNIELPNGLTEIPAECFHSTTGNGVFTIPASVTKIGDAAFFASKYTSFVFEDGTADLICGNQVFAGALMTSFEIPARMEEIGGAFFQNATSLTTLTFAEDRTKPLTAHKIEGAEAGFHLAGTSVTSLDIPGSVGVVPDGMANNVPLTSLTLGEGITKIGSYAFYGTALTTVTFPKSLVEISSAAFQGSSVLSEVNFVKGGTEDLVIGAWSFQACKIAALEIPARTTSIGAASFAGNKIATLTFEAGGTKPLVFEDGTDTVSQGKGYHFDQCPITQVVLPKRTVEITLPNVFPSTANVTYES